MTSKSYFGKMNSTLGSVVPLAMFLWYRLKKCGESLDFKPIDGVFNRYSISISTLLSSLKNCLCTFHKCDETAHHKNDFPTRDMVKIEQMVMMRWVDENDNS